MNVRDLAISAICFETAANAAFLKVPLAHLHSFIHFSHSLAFLTHLLHRICNAHLLILFIYLNAYSLKGNYN